MGLPKVRKKPTIKEMAGVIIEMNHKMESIHRYIGQLDNVLGLYIEMNKDNEKFNKFICTATAIAYDMACAFLK